MTSATEGVAGSGGNGSSCSGGGLLRKRLYSTVGGEPEVLVAGFCSSNSLKVEEEVIRVWNIGALENDDSIA